MPGATPPSSARTMGSTATPPFYEWSMKLWEGLEQDLNYNAMVSQRGVLNLYHSDGQRDAFARRGNAMRLHGVDAELLDRAAVRKLAPFLEFRSRALSDPGRPAAAARRHGAARRRRLGLCARRVRSRRRHHPELRSDRFHPRRARRHRRRRDHARHDPGEEGRRGRRRQLVARGRDGGPAAADRKPCAAGLRLRGAEAADPRRHHLRRRALLYQPVRQGRPGLRRRYRRLQLLCAAAAICRRSRTFARAAWR